tara:strand:- start:196 stop:495 length:300 start_codon:yes stop_codon:yes gene_type:complete
MLSTTARCQRGPVARALEQRNRTRARLDPLDGEVLGLGGLAEEERADGEAEEEQEEERVVEVVGDEVEGAAGRVATTEDVDASREDEGRDSSLASVASA